MKYSPSTRGFYVEEIHGDAIPSDALEVSVERHAELIVGQANGKEIVPGPDGLPVLADPAPAAAPSAADVERLRAAAYRNEADPLFFKFQRGDAKKAEWLAKIEEIKARYPKEAA